MISLSSILIAKPELLYPEAMRSSRREHQRTATFHNFIRMRGLWFRSGKPESGRVILGMLLAFFIFLPAMAQAQVAISTTALPAGNTSNTYYTTLAATGGTAPYT